jgi:hypothetical protein
MFMVLLSVYLINLGYLFESPFQPLRQFYAGQGVLHRLESVPRMANWLGSFPVPLPAEYVGGIDEIQRFRESGPWSYLEGQWRPGGWWYFYLYAFFIKLPIGTLLLLELALIATLVTKGYSAGWKAEFFFLFSMAAVLGFLIRSGAPQNLRYALPFLPLAYIWISKLARSFRQKDQFAAVAIAGCLAGSVLCSLWVYPHSLSYFNELANGPAHGYEYLTESNVDWGQDLLYLRKWLDEHPEVQSLRLAYLGRIDPRFAGIEFSLPPKAIEGQGPQPGWYAVSVAILTGFHWDHPDGKGGLERITAQDYLYFNRFRPVAMAGYSIHVYHITPDEANRVRRELGLAELPMDWRQTREGDAG